MPDPIKPEIDDPSAKKPEQAGVPVDQVTSLVSDFQETLKEMRKTPAAPVEAAPPVGPTQEEKLEIYNAAKQKANEMAAGGEYADALEHMYQTWTSLGASDQTTFDQTPAFKGLRSQAERVAKADNKDMFEKYGEEITQLVTARSPEDQINPDVWDDAVRQAKAAHIDEIMEEQFKARMDNLDGAGDGDAPARVAGGSRGRTTKGDEGEVELSAEQREFASRINFSEERYAKAVASYDEHTTSPGSVNILNEEVGAEIAPGKF